MPVECDEYEATEPLSGIRRHSASEISAGDAPYSQRLPSSSSMRVSAVTRTGFSNRYMDR
jgi:hypothetical protein